MNIEKFVASIKDEYKYVAYDPKKDQLVLYKDEIAVLLPKKKEYLIVGGGDYLYGDFVSLEKAKHWIGLGKL